jgi:hypothetical protein
VTESEQPASAPVSRASGGRSGGLLIWFLVLLLAVGLLVAAYFYAGGIGALQSLLNGGRVAPAGTSSAPAASVPASSTPADAMAAAKIAYAEQIESQQNISRLAKGNIAWFSVDGVKKTSDAAIVRITAHFRDGTSAPGEMRVVKSGDLWFLTTVTGLRPSQTGGLADATNAARSIAPSVTPDQKLAEVGVTHPDAAVLNALAEQELVNQPTVKALLAGEYQRYDLGAPVAGENTFTLPIVMRGKGEAATNGKIIVISQNVEGSNKLFITTFKRD